MGCNCGKPNNNVPVIPTIGQAVSGVVGFAKLVVPSNHASNDVIRTRRGICGACDQCTFKNPNNNQGGVTAASQCQKCSCLIKAKTTLKDEQCPEWKW